MQKTVHLVIHNVVKNNVSAAEMSRNAENTKNDTLAAQRQKTLPLFVEMLSKTT